VVFVPRAAQRGVRELARVSKRIKPEELQNIFRLDTRRTSGTGATHGWQVRIHRATKKYTQFFSDSKFESKDAALAAAIEYRDNLYEELGIDTGKYYIRTELMANNTTGIIGVSRAETLNRSGSIREYWQTAYPSPEHLVRTASFGVGRLGEIGALSKAIEARMEGISKLIDVPDFKNSRNNINTLIDRYLNILVYLEHITPQEEEFLVKTIANKTIRNTEKEDIITGRIGQQTFKDKLIKLWGGRCVVTGAQLLLNAAHIKPWAVSTDKERLDPFNGFLLSPSYDKAFDSGFITFSDSGEIIIAKALRPDMGLLGISETAKIENVSPFSAPYLAFHRENIFKDKLPNHWLVRTPETARHVS